jgi:hypothetical protein
VFSVEVARDGAGGSREEEAGSVARQLCRRRWRRPGIRVLRRDIEPQR